MANKNAASEDKLGELHSKVAKVMIDVLDTYDIANEKNREVIAAHADPETVPVVQEPSVAFLNACTKFLKDNEVTAAPADGESMSDLERALKEKRQARGRVVGLNGLPFEGGE